MPVFGQVSEGLCSESLIIGVDAFEPAKLGGDPRSKHLAEFLACKLGATFAFNNEHPNRQGLGQLVELCLGALEGIDGSDLVGAVVKIDDHGFVGLHDRDAEVKALCCAHRLQRDVWFAAEYLLDCQVILRTVAGCDQILGPQTKFHLDRGVGTRRTVGGGDRPGFITFDPGAN